MSLRRWKFVYRLEPRAPRRAALLATSCGTRCKPAQISDYWLVASWIDCQDFMMSSYVVTWAQGLPTRGRVRMDGYREAWGWRKGGTDSQNDWGTDEVTDRLLWMCFKDWSVYELLSPCRWAYRYIEWSGKSRTKYAVYDFQNFDEEQITNQK